MFYHFLLEPLEKKFQRPFIVSLYRGYFLDAHPTIEGHVEFWVGLYRKIGDDVWFKTARKWHANARLKETLCPEFKSMIDMFCWAYELLLEKPLKPDFVELILNVHPPQFTTWEDRLRVWERCPVSVCTESTDPKGSSAAGIGHSYLKEWRWK